MTHKTNVNLYENLSKSGKFIKTQAYVKVREFVKFVKILEKFRENKRDL